MYKKLLLAIAAVVGLSGTIAGTALAAEFMVPGPKDQGKLFLESTTVFHNLYAVGQTVIIDSPVDGDLYVAGGSVTITNQVEQDLVAAAGKLAINAPVGGDVRVAGGTVTITQPIDGDLLVAGGTVNLEIGAAIEGDLVISGGEVTVNGPINGNVKIVGGDILINNTVSGKVKIDSDNSLTFGPQAAITEKVDHSGRTEAVVKEGAQLSGGISYQKLDNRQHRKSVGALAGIFTFAFIVKLIAFILAGLVAIALFRNYIFRVTETIPARPLAYLGIGFLTLVATPIIGIILAITLVGYFLGMLLLLAYAFAVMFAFLLSAIATGAWLIKWLTKKPAVEIDWQAVVIGSVVFMVVCLVPFIGWLAVAVWVLIVLGAIVMTVGQQIRDHIR